MDALGAVLGAGVLLAPALAAGMAGGWLPYAVVLAALVAVLGTAASGAVATGRAGRRAGRFLTCHPAPAAMVRALRPIGVPARVFAAGAVARCAGTYVLPERSWYPAVAMLVFAGALAVLVSRGALRTPRRLATVVVLVVLSIVVITCFAIGPPGNAAVPDGLSGANDAAMIPAAAALLVFGFGGGARGGRGRTAVPVAAGAICLLLVFAMLRQLGPGRLAAAPAPVAAALAAADGEALMPLLLAAVVLAALAVSYGAVTEATTLIGRRGVTRTTTHCCVVVAAVLVALFLPVVTAIAVASGCLLLEWLCAHVLLLARPPARGTVRGPGQIAAFALAAVGAALTVVLFVQLPLASLVIALGLSVLAVSLGAWRRSAAGARRYVPPLRSGPER